MSEPKAEEREIVLILTERETYKLAKLIDGKQNEMFASKFRLWKEIKRLMNKHSIKYDDVMAYQIDTRNPFNFAITRPKQEVTVN